jgi:hypothetical protein
VRRNGGPFIYGEAVIRIGWEREDELKKTVERLEVSEICRIFAAL